MKESLSNDLKKKIDFLILYIGDSTDDWIKVKIELINSLPLNQRIGYSKRHKSSKKYYINDLEESIIDYWKEKTGIKLFIEEHKLHKLEDERPSKNWGLMLYNKKRKEAKILREIHDEQK